MQTQTVIQHNTNPQGLISELAEVLFNNHLRPFLEQLQTAQPENKLRTRKETAERLNIALSTLHEYTKTGMIKGKRIGGRVLYSDEDITNALTTINAGKN